MTGPGDAARAALEEERDLLLRSLDDLDAEHEAGEVGDDDYTSLRDDYTARAAAVLRRLEQPQSVGDTASAAGDDGSESRSTRATSGRGRLAVIVVALTAFAIGAGLLVARTAGERGVGDELTGGIDESARNKVLRCQELGSSGGDLVGSLQCFDEILATDPENAEALAYRGWYLLLAGGSLQQSAGEDDADALELIASGLGYLDRAVAADPDYPDPLAFRATLLDRLGRSDEACADVAALLALDPPQFFVQQTAALAERNGCPHGG